MRNHLPSLLPGLHSGEEIFVGDRIDRLLLESDLVERYTKVTDL